MVGKQWVMSWGINRWAGVACTKVKEVSNNRGYDAESNALNHNPNFLCLSTGNVHFKFRFNFF